MKKGSGIKFWVVDISNSYTKYALSSTNSLFKIQRHPTSQITSEWIKKKFKSSDYPLVLSSVVPTKTTLFKKELSSSTLHLLNGKTALGIGIQYPKPEQIGADRLANSIAAFHLHGAPAIVIDFGTAVTFDVIDSRGNYTGGVIAPGLNLMTQYLHEKTALLPHISIRKPQRAIGKSTEEAMLSGAVYGYRGLIKEILIELRREMRAKVKVIATGGQAEIVTNNLREIDEIDPLLTLQGLRIYYNRLKLKPRKSV